VSTADTWVAQIADDYTKAPLIDIDRVLCDFSIRLTKTPGAMTESDVRALREVGLDDVGINDAVQVIAYFNYINRVADGLGVDLEPDMPKPRE
jgi:uncharacterized peroxidase-related enzyme